MSDPTNADWLALSLQLNREAFRQPPAENWLRSFLDALRGLMPGINAIQAVQVIGSSAITLASGGELPPELNIQPALDPDSPMARILDTRERQITPDLRAYPILYGGDAIGALFVYTSSLPAIIDDALSLIATQLGPALIQQTSRIHTARLEQLIELSRQLSTVRDRSSILRIVAAATRHLIAVDGISVALRWPGEPNFQLYLIDQDQVLPPIGLLSEQGALSAIVESGTSIIVDDLSSGDRPDYQILARHAPQDGWEAGPAMRTALITPLLAGEGSIGTYNLTRQQTSVFTALDQSLAMQVAAQLAIVLENGRLFRQAAEHIQIEQLRSQIGTGSSAGDLTALVLETTQGIGRALNARRARVRFMPPGDESAG